MKKNKIYYENNKCVVYKLDWINDRYEVCYKNNPELNFYTNKSYLERYVINGTPIWRQLSIFGEDI